ncbi:MAG: cobalamin-binding protein, partial [Acidobacteria bacterium]
QGLSLYQIDEQLLQQLAPDLILTQNLCQVCAPSGNEVSHVLKALPKAPEILWLTPRSIDEIFENIRDLGAATGKTGAATELIQQCQQRLDQLSALTSHQPHRPRVFCMEWLDPVYACGHWVPELVKIAGGIDELGSERGESVRVTWAQIVEWAPEVLIIMPCGFNLQHTMKQIWSTFSSPTILCATWTTSS